MSWNLQVYGHNAAELLANLATATASTGESNPEMEAQIATMKGVAEVLVRTSAVQLPTENHMYSLYLSGHANAGHALRNGWSNDMVTAQLSVMDKPAPKAELFIPSEDVPEEKPSETPAAPEPTAPSENGEAAPEEAPGETGETPNES